MSALVYNSSEFTVILKAYLSGKRVAASAAVSLKIPRSVCELIVVTFKFTRSQLHSPDNHFYI